MGAHWVGVRDAVAAGTLRASDKGAPEVAARFDALLRFASLRLGRRLGSEVTPLLSRKELAEPELRTQALVGSLVSTGTMTGSIRIPNTVGPIEVTLDLRAGRVSCHVDLEAPKDGRPATRVNWVVRQLKNAPDTVRVEAYQAYARGAGTAGLLRDVRANPTVLLTDPKKDIRTFRLALTSPLGPKRGRGRGGAIDSVLDAVDIFYSDVLGQLKAWTAAPPKLREDSVIEPLPPVETELVSTSLSSQDNPEPATPEIHHVGVPTLADHAAGLTSLAAQVADADRDETPPAWRDFENAQEVDDHGPLDGPVQESGP
jgi:hypothetical protein